MPKHVIINPKLTLEEIQKVKALREYNPNLRLWLFERSGLRTISSLEKEWHVRFYKRNGYFVREISTDINE